MRNTKLVGSMLLGFTLFVIQCGDKPSPQTDVPRQPQAEYTKDIPAEWAGLEAEHLPEVSFDENDGNTVIIRVNFPLKRAADHYIQKIGIMDKNGIDIAVKEYKADADYYDTRFTVNGLPKGTKVYVRCSLHDLWTSPIESKSFWF